jgi:hypothetical protein
MDRKCSCTQKVTIVEEDHFRLLVVLIAAFLIVSLLINALLTVAPVSVTGPPLKVDGYFGADGRPVDGYYSSSPGIAILPPQSPSQTPVEATPPE